MENYHRIFPSFQRYVESRSKNKETVQLELRLTTVLPADVGGLSLDTESSVAECKYSRKTLRTVLKVELSGWKVCKPHNRDEGIVDRQHAQKRSWMGRA